MGKLVVGILEDHPVIIKSIHDQLDDEKFEVLECGNIECAKAQLKDGKLNVLICDIRLSNRSSAFDLFENNKEQLEQVNIIIYSSYISPWLFVKLHRIGIQADAVIEKIELPDWNLVISDIVLSKKYYSTNASKSLQMVRKDPKIGSLLHLSDRKWEVLMEILKGRSDKEIAALLSISKFTANDHRKALYKLLNKKDVPSIMFWFREIGFFDLETT